MHAKPTRRALSLSSLEQTRRPQPALFPISDKPPAFLEEAAGPRYVVEVDVDAPPLPAGHTPDLPPGARSLTLPGPGGARFACTIPPPPPPDEEAAAAAASAAASAPSPSALIASLDGACLYRMEDWWTYELCPGVHARQFHREGEGRDGEPGAIVSEFVLGRFNASEPVSELRSDPAGPPEEAVAYVAQEYGGGQGCDLTGTPRGVEVRFVCADGHGGDGRGAAGGSHLEGSGSGSLPPTGPRDALLAVREPATCRYTFTVGVADLCAHPGFRQVAPPTLAVRCVPVEREGAEGVQAV